jgi:hypothetical protein
MKNLNDDDEEGLRHSATVHKFWSTKTRQPDSQSNKRTKFKQHTTETIKAKSKSQLNQTQSILQNDALLNDNLRYDHVDDLRTAPTVPRIGVDP